HRDEASNGLSRASSELEVFKRGAATAMAQLDIQIANLKSEHRDVEATHYLEEVRFREYPTAADGSERIAKQIKILRAQQREMITGGTALFVHGELEQYFSQKVGQVESFTPAKKAFIYKAFSTLFLKTFNLECEMAVRQLRRDSGYEVSYSRILSAYEGVSNAGLPLGVRISDEYLHLRMDECRLVFDHLAAKAIERLERTAERERLRDEQKAQEEYDFALIQFDKELEHYRIMLARMWELGDEEAIARYDQLITGIEEQAAEIRLRAQNIRAGYVYIISNIGSFGEGIVKIGLTRRLEPMNRVKELSNASVPFRYDVHALYFSQDAVSLETALHHHFEDRRVNKINRRREFFHATPQEVLQALKAHDVDLVEWVQDPEATEFRLTQGQHSKEPRLEDTNATSDGVTSQHPLESDQ
ncbi:DUF4041 domain-containing protein, partial [Specibacter sp. NPDC078692]|uniref:GIY-YIG nuclease family protein n=1 Tax=Specibacter sp. NPDC078692 TaxID=3155818 RepID=UPI003437B7BC